MTPSKELGKSHSFISGDTLSHNSSFTVLPDGSVKRKRMKTSYKDIFLEKVNRRLANKSQTHYQSHSYSKYKMRQKDNESYDIDEMTNSNIASKTKENITMTQTSSYLKEAPKHSVIDFPFSNSMENNSNNKNEGHNHSVKGKKKILLTDVVDLNYPLQINQDKEIKGSRNIKQNPFDSINDYYDEIIFNSNEKKSLLIKDDYTKEIEIYLDENTEGYESIKANNKKENKQRNTQREMQNEEDNNNKDIQQNKLLKRNSNNFNIITDNEESLKGDEKDSNYIEGDSEFSVHESENYRYDINGKDNNDNENEIRHQLLGSESEQNDYTDNNNNNVSNNIDNEENEQNKEECHQIQCSKEDNEMQKNQKPKAYCQISEIVEEENEEALLNSQKYSNTTNQQLLISSSHKENDIATSMSISNIIYENLLKDNKMSIEELNALNEKSEYKSSKRDCNTLRKQLGFNVNALNQSAFSVQIAQYKTKEMSENDKYSMSHFQIEIGKQIVKGFIGLLKIKSHPLINYHPINKQREDKNNKSKYESVQYSLNVLALKKEKEIKSLTIQRCNCFEINNSNSIIIVSNRKSIELNQNDNQSNCITEQYKKDLNSVLKSKAQTPKTRLNNLIEQNYQIDDDNPENKLKSKDNNSNQKTLWTLPKAVSSMITISDKIMSNGCIQKKNVININKHKKEDLSNIQIDDLIDQIKEKTSKKNKTKHFNGNQNKLLFANDSPIKINSGKLLFSRPESTGNITYHKDKGYIYTLEEMIHCKKKHIHNQGYTINKKAINNEIEYELETNHHGKEYNINIKKDKQTNNLPNKQFVMPANTLETLLAKREEVFFSPEFDQL